MTKRKGSKTSGLGGLGEGVYPLHPSHLLDFLPSPYKYRILKEFGEIIPSLVNGEARVWLGEDCEPGARVNLEFQIPGLPGSGVLLDFGTLLGEGLCRVWKRVFPSVRVKVEGLAFRGIDDGEDGRFEVTLTIYCWSLEEIFGGPEFPALKELTPEKEALVSLLTAPVEGLEPPADSEPDHPPIVKELLKLGEKNLEFFEILKRAWERKASREKITKAIRKFLRGEKVKIARCPICGELFPLVDERTLTCSPRCRQRKRRRGHPGGEPEKVKEFEARLRQKDPEARDRVINLVMELCGKWGEAFERLKAEGVIDSKCYPLVDDFEERIEEICKGGK